MPGPIIVADFNAKFRSWCGGPEDRRGPLLDEMMVVLDKTRTTDDMARYYTTEMSRACDVSMLQRRRQNKNQRPDVCGTQKS